MGGGRCGSIRSISTCLWLAVAAAGCASPAVSPRATPVLAEPSIPSTPSIRAGVVRVAEAQLGRPYRPGGRSPAGFDCSGLVVYSYARAGLSGLPHSAAALERVAQSVPIDEVEAGDLLFFHLGGRKASHVAIYLGDREFVHAPSSGKEVERVSFDHVYWSGQLGRAGRLAR